MVTGALRVLLGFTLACLVAGLTMVLFVYTPLEFAKEPSGERVSQAGLLALAVATQAGVFAAPFAVIGVGFAEWQRIGGWLYYALVGVGIAVVGFAAQSWTESGGEGGGSILNGYAVTAFLVTGVAAGLIYWLCAGRWASVRPGERVRAQETPAGSELPQADKPGGTSAGLAS
jgi:hypothetical protein